MKKDVVKNNEFRKMNTKELYKELFGLQREHFNLRLQISTGQMTRPHLIKIVKRNIARVKTILGKKELTGSENE